MTSDAAKSSQKRVIDFLTMPNDLQTILMYALTKSLSRLTIEFNGGKKAWAICNNISPAVATIC